ncbi:MAG: amidohydrolase [Lachnospiraceae bacterium]|nr:amidohydrolase [Lachnospiraceae bacterium]
MQQDMPLFWGELQVEDGKITYVGEEKKVSGDAWDRQIDAEGNLLMPGFKNAHTHSAMTFLRSYADDLPLQEWLYNQVFPMEAKLTEEDVYWAAMLANLEYLTSGITANFDMYMKNESNAKASADMGFRTVLCGSINDFGGTVEEIEEEYLHFNKYNPLISYQLGFHAEYTTKRQILEDMAALGKKYKAPVFTHNSETENEVAGCIERYGTTPTAFLNSLGMFDYGGGGFHCVHMTQEDLEICKEKGIWVVTNPSSNVKLASGIAPIQKMLSMGIGLAIGTDGPASNNCLDMFREMFLVTALQKVSLSDAAAVDALEVLHMATAGGARAMGLADCDVLAEGKCADMVLLDLQKPNMQPLNNITKNIVYSGSKQNVKMTMIDGKILYEDGVFHVGTAPEEIYAKVNESITRMKSE